MTNTNPSTGIRYGVISGNSLNPDVLHELMYGPNAVDMQYEQAYAEAKAGAHSRYDDAVEEAEIAASEVDPNMGGADREVFIEKWLDEAGYPEDYVERELQEFADRYESDSFHYEGELDGVTYMVTTLGGAPLVWAIEGPVGVAERLCSPCVPNAADLDSGFLMEAEDEAGLKGDCMYVSYVVPREWLAGDQS